MLSNCLLPSVQGPSRSNSLSPSLPYLPLGPSQSSSSHVGPHVVSCRQMCVCTSGLCALSCLVGFSSATVWQRGPSLSVLLHSLSIQTHFCSFSVYLFVFPIRKGPLWGKGPSLMVVYQCLVRSFMKGWIDGWRKETLFPSIEMADCSWSLKTHWKHCIHWSESIRGGKQGNVFSSVFMSQSVWG